MNLLVRFFVWLFPAKYDHRALPGRRPQCACPTDEEGLMRCEGLADVDCRGGCCLVHCRKLCGERCKALLTTPQTTRLIERCRAQQHSGSPHRCSGIADPRCGGANCTAHCRQHCRGECLKLRVV